MALLVSTRHDNVHVERGSVAKYFSVLDYT